MSFLRAHGVALVATLWLAALLVGIPPVVAIAFGLPAMGYAWRAYVAELRSRRYRR